MVARQPLQSLVHERCCGSASGGGYILSNIEDNTALRGIERDVIQGNLGKDETRERR